MVRRPSVPSNPRAREYLTTCKPPFFPLCSPTQHLPCSRPRWSKAEASHVEAWAAELPHRGGRLPVFGPVRPMWLAMVGGGCLGGWEVALAELPGLEYPRVSWAGSGSVFSSKLVLCNVTLLITLYKQGTVWCLAFRAEQRLHLCLASTGAVVQEQTT